jgi:hypothetical protein
VFLHIIREIIQAAMHAQWAELTRIGIHQTCHIYSVVDPAHPNRLYEVICFGRGIPGMAHPLTGH